MSASSTVYKNFPPEAQKALQQWWEAAMTKATFSRSVTDRLVLKEVMVSKREKDGKLQSRVTFETIVAPDMLNIVGSLHGGCGVFLIDTCSSAALTALALVTNKPALFVSQALNTTFHAPATVGSTIEVVNTTVSFGARMVSTITEIWDVTNGRLCMTGVHNKMAPSPSKAKL